MRQILEKHPKFEKLFFLCKGETQEEIERNLGQLDFEQLRVLACQFGVCHEDLIKAVCDYYCVKSKRLYRRKKKQVDRALLF